MKSTRVNPSDRVIKAEYPCLKVHKNGHFACLFTSNTSGTVVWIDGSHPWSIGDHDDTWIASGFEPMVGTIELSND